VTCSLGNSARTFSKAQSISRSDNQRFLLNQPFCATGISLAKSSSKS
jgi:hypothetical protein